MFCQAYWRDDDLDPAKPESTEGLASVPLKER